MNVQNTGKWVKRAIALAVAVAAAGAFFGWPTKSILEIQPSASWKFLALLALTPVVGRFFCECLCPLGALQSFVNWLFHPKTHVRRVCTRLPQTRAQICVRVAVLAAFGALLATGFGALAWLAGPYSIFGKALTLFVPGVVVFAVVMVLAAVGKGRFWCNWVCPFGTCFSFLSRRSICRHKVAEGCSNCRACFAAKAPAAPAAEGGAGKSAEGVTRREALHGAAMFAAVSAVEKTTDGGFAETVLPGVPKRPATVMPPGAVSRREFNLKCVACGRCISHCPSGLLRPSVSLASFGQPEMFFQEGFCRIACGYKCVEACPVGALRPVDAAVKKRNFHIGLARVEKELCIRTTDGVECKACSRKCPVGAIRIVDGLPSVDERVCIGCGACEYVCAARPEPAIRVEGLEVQRGVPSEDDAALIVRMKGLLAEGASCVVARDGVVTGEERGDGIKPLLALLDCRRLENAIVVDKVIGRAAAAICIAGKARKVHASVMSAGAQALLARHGVEAGTDEKVERIMNRDKTGLCPMERTVERLDEPWKMVRELRRKLGV